MKSPICTKLSRRAPQRGAALIVALILLLVLTILGITAINSSVLQSYMASSYQQQTRTLASAENTLLQAELEIEDIAASGVNTNKDRSTYYANRVTGTGPTFVVTDLSTWPANGFFIEYLGRRIIPGESVVVGGGLEDSLVHVFRASALERRDPGERGGLRIVQSLYVTVDGPDE